MCNNAILDYMHSKSAPRAIMSTAGVRRVPRIRWTRNDSDWLLEGWKITSCQSTNQSSREVNGFWQDRIPGITSSLLSREVVGSGKKWQKVAKVVWRGSLCGEMLCVFVHVFGMQPNDFVRASIWFIHWITLCSSVWFLLFFCFLNDLCLSLLFSCRDSCLCVFVFVCLFSFHT